MQRDRLQTHLLLVAIIIGLGSFLFFRRERSLHPMPDPTVAPSGEHAVAARSESVPSPEANSAGSIPTPGPVPAPLPDVPRAPGRLVVRLEWTPPGKPGEVTLLVIGKSTATIDGQQDLENEVEAVFDPIKSGPKIVAVVPHSSSIAPAYVEAFVSPESQASAVVTLSPGKPLEGTVVDLQGAPVEKAEVTASIELGYSLPRTYTGISQGFASTSPDGTSWAFSGLHGTLWRGVQTDAAGRFRIENTGPHPLEVSAKSGTAKSLVQTVLPGTPVRLVVQR